MKNSIRFFVSIVLVCAFFFSNLPIVSACGPYTLEPIFSLKKHSDYPLQEYTNGKVGIVPQSYEWIPLFVFYRQLINLPLTKEEQNQVVDAMSMRKGMHWVKDENSQKANNNQQDDSPAYIEKWIATRAKVLSSKTEFSTEKKAPDSYNYFSNCLPDAFRNATKTLEARITKYGATDPNVKEWVAGQDTVFTNCDGPSEMPKELSQSAPEWLRRDRLYQIAAAYFYASKIPEARDNFEKIAVDNDSVWNKTAKFVIARTYIREASFVQIPEKKENEVLPQEKQRDELLQKASMQLENILADSSMKEFQESAYRLLGLVKYRSMPEARTKELANILVQPNENRNIYNDLTDYTWLLSYIATRAEAKGTEIDQKQATQEGREYDYEYQTKLRDVPSAEREQDLTDWIFSYSAPDGFEHAFEKWKQSGKLHWFVAAIINAKKDAPQVDEILREADSIQRSSPAYATVRHHQIQLLLDMGKRAEAKQKLNEVFANSLKEFPVSAQNEFLTQRLTLAENLDEFLKYAQRKPSIFIWSGGEDNEYDASMDDKKLSVWKTRTMFDNDAVAFLNEKMPLSVLRQAALNPQLPEHLKKFLVVAVWTRAFTLGNQAVEKEFTPLMLRYAKEFSPLFSKYASAANAANREAAALIAVLRYPVIQPYVPVGFGREDSEPTSIDSIRGNWWCVEDENAEVDENNGDDKSHYDHYPFIYPDVYPNFLTNQQQAEAKRELQQMKIAGDSSTFLTRRALEFAARNPNHPQTPEILHLAVRSTRYGCQDNETGKFSQEAFQILHKRYPASPWTKKTPFWFGSN